MLIFFKGQISTDAVFQRMQAQATVALAKKKSNFNPVQVESQIPSWLKGENGNKVSGLGTFLQAYYDWLANGYGNTGVNIMDVSSLIDIDETPDSLLPNFIQTYAPDISGIYDLPEDVRPKDSDIRNTIKNIRTEVYRRKSNEEAFRSLMGSLFSIDPETIQFSYPKRKLLRLNGGILDWMIDSTYYAATGEYSNERYTVVGSHLNQGVMPDGKMWQEYSYLLTSEIDDSNPYYEDVIKKTLNPAGLLGLYEKVEVYSEGGYDPGPVTIHETPKISNYYPYNILSTQTLDRCIGCTGELSYPGWRHPTFVYPSWDVEISQKNSEDFGSIILDDFFTLSPISGQVWPNEEIGTDCNIACGESGNTEFLYFVDNQGQTEPILLGGSEEFFFNKESRIE
jgi:hypothetical protein